jgi:hypothetical protein
MHSRRKMYNFTLQGPQNNVHQHGFSCSVCSSSNLIEGSSTGPTRHQCSVGFVSSRRPQTDPPRFGCQKWKPPRIPEILDHIIDSIEKIGTHTHSIPIPHRSHFNCRRATQDPTTAELLYPQVRLRWRLPMPPPLHLQQRTPRWIHAPNWIIC